MDKKIILASQSPRRKEILSNLGLGFEVVPSTIDEDIHNKTFSFELVKNTALEKAQDVASKISEPSIIIAADTVVVFKNKILGKPANEEEAFNMLKTLSGNKHFVVSAIAIIDTSTGKTLVDFVESQVKFREISENEIKKYIETGEPMDKAGAYGIQKYGSIFVESVCGCYFNIVGISAYKLAEMLKQFGVFIF